MFTHTQEEDYVSSVSQTICCFCRRSKMMKARLVPVTKLVFPPSIKGVTTVLQHANSGVQRAEQNLKQPQAPLQQSLPASMRLMPLTLCFHCKFIFVRSGRTSLHEEFTLPLSSSTLQKGSQLCKSYKDPNLKDSCQPTKMLVSITIRQSVLETVRSF